MIKKKTLVVSVILITSVASNLIFAQTDDGYRTEISKPTCVIAYEPAFMLDAGVDNVLHIAVKDTSIKRLLVNASQGTVRQDGEDFIVRPEKFGHVTLKIFNYNDLNNPIFIEERTLHVELQDLIPPVTLAGKRGGEISKGDLLAANGLQLSTSGRKLKLVQCKISITGKDAKYKEFNLLAENFTPEMKELFKSLAAGTKIYIENIRVKTSNSCDSRSLAPMTFVLTD